MIEIKLIGHNLSYPIIEILDLFWGKSSVVIEDKIQTPAPVDWEIESFYSAELGVGFLVRNQQNEIICQTKEIPSYPLALNREIKRQLYEIMVQLTGKKIYWGSLTGIRPTLVANEVKDWTELRDYYGVDPQKAQLAVTVGKAEQKILSQTKPEGMHCYVGIPFCKSRCSYCSFIAQDSVKNLKLLNLYQEQLIREIQQTYFLWNQRQAATLAFETFYLGGGTPTVFEDEVFAAFIKGIFTYISAAEIKEITVEAGRADTISQKKLEVLKAYGVHRICINPQTLHNSTLERIGRQHTVEDFYKCYEWIQQLEFDSINSDLIAGLPEESLEDYQYSVEGLLALAPDNITIHTLAKKRTALMQTGVVKSTDEEVVKQMLDYSHSQLLKAGYQPYYMYRQKDTLGGHENIGYTKPGKGSTYNVVMMSDRRNIMGFGAGSVSKRIFPGQRLERCHNLKHPHDYVQRAKEMADKKVKFFLEEEEEKR